MMEIFKISSSSPHKNKKHRTLCFLFLKKLTEHCKWNESLAGFSKVKQPHMVAESLWPKPRATHKTRTMHFTESSPPSFLSESLQKLQVLWHFFAQHEWLYFIPWLRTKYVAFLGNGWHIRPSYSSRSRWNFRLFHDSSWKPHLFDWLISKSSSSQVIEPSSPKPADSTDS